MFRQRVEYFAGRSMYISGLHALAAEVRRLHVQRQGVERTISQAVRGFGLRQARYRGFAKTGLQHIVTSAAVNLDRMAAWFDGRPLAPTRTSRFAAVEV